MLERLKQSVVESYVGAIALGWPLAQILVHFANIFTAPVAGWILRREYRGFTEHTTLLPGFSLQDAVPELFRSVSLLLVWYILLRWLYFKPVKKETGEPTPDSEQGA